MRLQLFDFRSSRYERPNRSWVCGRAETGQACVTGPDQQGRCRAVAECRPVRRGDRWLCTRSKLRGGPCSDGPLPDGACCRPIEPCQPVRSLRARRGLVVRWLVTVLVGLLALVFSDTELATSILSPGPLSVFHAEVEDCAACHTAADSPPIDWIHHALTPPPAAQEMQGCVACHHPMGGSALTLAHGLPAEQLASEAPSLDPAPPCARCHSEHRGRRFDAKKMEPERCQACHSLIFDRFASGHPEFEAYPIGRHVRIAYDHQSHATVHFPQAKPPVNKGCRACHLPDPTMRTRPYQATCAECHQSQIDGRDLLIGPAGVPVLALPGLDLETLRRRGIEIGPWPEAAQGGIPPIMALLLSADPSAAEALTAIRSLDLLDLQQASTDDIAAVGALARAIRKLFEALLHGGPEVVEDRLRRALGQKLDSETVAALVAALPRDAIWAAQQEWLPGEAQGETSGNTQQARDRPDEAGRGPLLAPDGETGSGGNSEGALLEDDSRLSGEGALLEDDSLLSGEGALLEDDSLLSGEGALLEDDSLLSGEGALLEDDSAPLDQPSAGEAAEPISRPSTPSSPPPPDTEAWASWGGWYRKDFTLFYRPVAHEDAFLRAWLDAAYRPGAESGQDWRQDLFAILSGKEAPGRCVKCHLVEGDEGQPARLLWRSEPRRIPGPATLTVFRHAPHLTVLGRDGCPNCHQIAKGEQGKSGRHQSPATDFAQISKAICTDCHVKNEADDSCTLCHRYHAAQQTTR